MITKRDNQILIWIEKFKSITINQCAKIFFTKNKQAYDQARKRLRYLNKEGLLKRYRKDPRNQTVYYMDRKLKIHDLKIFDVVAEFIYCGWEIHRFNKESSFIIKDKKYVVDSKIVFKKDATYMPIILEIDYSHMTGIGKVNDIVSTFKNNKYKKTFIIVRLTQEKIKIVETKNTNTELIYLPWNLTGLNTLICPIVQ